MEHGCLCLLGDSVCKGVVLDLEKNRYVHEKASFGNLVTESGLMLPCGASGRWEA